jgi:hypothetical protein
MPALPGYPQSKQRCTRVYALECRHVKDSRDSLSTAGDSQPVPALAIPRTFSSVP